MTNWTPYPDQQRVIDAALNPNVNAVVWLAGRRTGKTSAGVEIARRATLAGVLCFWFSPTATMLKAMQRNLARRDDVQEMNATRGLVRFKDAGEPLRMHIASSRFSPFHNIRPQVVIFDEPGLMSRRHFRILRRQAREHGAKMVFIGGFVSMIRTRDAMRWLYRLSQRLPNWTGVHTPGFGNPYTQRANDGRLLGLTPSRIERAEHEFLGGAE